MGLFFSPFKWLWIVFAVIALAIFGIILVSTIYFGLALGHAIFFGVPTFPVPFFGLGFLVLVIIIVGLVVGLQFRPYRRRMYYSRHWYPYDSAMDSLRQRYARGEITRDQFEQMASDLERHR